MGRPSLDKGKRGEREVAAILRAAGFDAVRRGWQSRAGSDDPDVIGLPGFWIEVGLGRTIKPRAKLAQAVEASAGKHGVVPVAVTRGARRSDEWVVTMTLFDLIGIARRLGVDPSGETSDAPCFVADVLRDAVVRGQRAGEHREGGG